MKRKTNRCKTRPYCTTTATTIAAAAATATITMIRMLLSRSLLMKCAYLCIQEMCHVYKFDICLFHRCLRLVSNYKRTVALVEYSCIQEQTENGSACDADATQLLTVLEAKLHLLKAHNYQWRGPAFQNDCFYELKQALLCNPGNASTPVLQIGIQKFLWLT